MVFFRRPFASSIVASMARLLCRSRHEGQRCKLGKGHKERWHKAEPLVAHKGDHLGGSDAFMVETIELSWRKA